MTSTETTTTPVETLQPLKRYEMDPDRIEVRTSVETADLRIEVTVEGPREDEYALRARAQQGLDAAMEVTW